MIGKIPHFLVFQRHGRVFRIMYHQVFHDLRLDLAWIDTGILDNVAQHIDLRQFEQSPARDLRADNEPFLIREGFF